jgi:hypothetical protein
MGPWRDGSACGSGGSALVGAMTQVANAGSLWQHCAIDVTIWRGAADVFDFVFLFQFS